MELQGSAKAAAIEEEYLHFPVHLHVQHQGKVKAFSNPAEKFVDSKLCQERGHTDNVDT